MREGWIRLHRKIIESSIYPKNREFTKFEAWIDLLLLANHTDQDVLIKNEIYICKRGQSIRSIETYQKLWNWTPQMVRSFLNLLEKLSMIERKTTNKTTILTICNYDKYQCEQQTDNKRITNGKQTDNKRITTNKNEKNEKNEKKKNIYSNFYDSEIEKNEAAPNLEFYKKFVKTIYGENDLNRELTEILQFKEQLTFQQFEKIYKLRAENKKSIQETLLKIANDSKYWKGKSNLYMTLRNWITGRFEK